MPDGLSDDALLADWRVTLLDQLNTLIRDYQLVMIPVIASADRDAALPDNVKPLKDILDVKDDDKLPGLYMYHPVGGKPIRYPGSLENKDTAKAKGIIVWANMSLLEIETTFLKQKIEVLESGDLPKEEQLESKHIESIKELLKGKEEELKDLRQAYEVILQVIEDV